MPARSRAAAGIASAAAGLVLSACALLAPLPERKDVAGRLAAFPTRGLPLEGRVTIYWSERQIPFIEAETDGDAAFALGLVHAHLRLGQMATARMLARGRLSEMIGPLGVDIDRGLRTLSYARAAAEIERGMDEAALGWVRRFVDGLNRYQDSAAEPAARLRRPRPRARALDGGRPARHRASRRHRRELAGVGRSAEAARAGRLARALGADGEGGEDVVRQLRRRRANRRRDARGWAGSPNRAATASPWLGAAQRHRRRADRQRPPSRHSRSQCLADRGRQVALLSRGGADGAGAAGLRHRPQPAHRLGRHQHARGLQRSLRCRRPAGIGDRGAARADRRALVVRQPKRPSARQAGGRS